MLIKKDFKKIVLILLISIIIMILNSVHVEASFFSEIMDDASTFASSGTQNNISGDGIKNMFIDLFGVFITAGAVVAFIITAILGVKFLLASPEGKAEVKETMTPYVIGCIVTFGAYTIWNIVINILSPLG